ncbi:MAG: efflux RND transporter periplasmic adaptor subunit [Deltaproteobacteria bacterium]|nr:efflux RND transporter periplasmic adaptor subunit [Deltaproteobacteria bacterium]
MNGKRKRYIFQAGVVALFLFLGFVGMKGLIAGKPEMEKTKRPAPTMAVRVIPVEAKPSTVVVKGEGTVRPESEINLVPQVSGKVIEVSNTLADGGRFQKGDVLLRIDPVDYRLALTLAEAKVKDAESRLQVAREEAAAALEEWNELHPPGSPDAAEAPPLVLKVPQLKAAEAKLEAERAELKKAELHLERTVLRAPFNGIVKEENVDVGQYVVAGQSLATLFSTDVVEVVVPLEDRDFSWFHVPGFTPGDEKGSSARVKARLAGKEWIWEGKVVRTEGKMDERTRMINVVIRVERPYDRKPPLAMGLFVQVEIEGMMLPKAVRIPVASFREGDTVWVVDEKSRLRFRQVVPGRIDRDAVLITEGLKDGDRVVISGHAAVTDGMAVRVLDGKGGSAS